MTSHPPADYAAAQDYLFGLKAGGVKFGVDRMRVLAERLAHPERRVPCLHVAGTNGKGSVAAMLEAVLRRSGWRVGLYTSPHLVRLGERVQVDRRPLSEAEILAYIAELRPVMDAIGAENPDDRPSFFEFMTAAAFLHFARERCDVAVIEVGLGGRLDATNIVLPEATVITSIGLDHCDLLGDTLEQIAAEKAGIVKPGRPVVMGRVPPAAEAVIRRIARERGAPLRSVVEEFGAGTEGYPGTNLPGDHQRGNAAAALLALRALGPRWRLSEPEAAQALCSIAWPGRWDVRRIGGRTVVLDASHNPEGAEVLDRQLAGLRRETGRAPIVVAGALGESRARALLAAIARHAAEIRLAVPKQARACGYGELEAAIPAGFRGPVLRETVESLVPRAGVVDAGGPDDVVVVTGSIYLLGEVLGRLEPQRGLGEGRLQDF
ncbi:MAG: bifunctional folylpolyglutamate synthase/dihydrofolate synthase [Opitutaceae bacterium]